MTGPWVIALSLAGLTGVLEYVMGRDVAVSAFYLMPICWASWAVGRWLGLLFCGVFTLFISPRPKVTIPM